MVGRRWIGCVAVLGMVAGLAACANSGGSGGSQSQSGATGGTGTGTGGSTSSGSSGSGSQPAAGGGSPGLTWDSYDHEFVAPPQESWNRFQNSIISRGTPHHGAYDLFLWQGHSAQLRAKFHYGDLYKDLEGEKVGCWLRSPGGAGWVHLGDATTDRDGRAELPFPQQIQQPGTYFLKWLAYGDLTTADAIVRVVDANTDAVVFDIDGTLTTDDEQTIFQVLGQLVNYVHQPAMYVDANTVANGLKDQGYEVFYLTARPYWLRDLSRDWLMDKGFPLGTVTLYEGSFNTLTNSDAARDYKEAALGARMAEGAAFQLAFGNAESDIEAYALTSIPATVTYVIGPNAGVGGTNALNAYTDLIGNLIP